MNRWIRDPRFRCLKHQINPGSLIPRSTAVTSPGRTGIYFYSAPFTSHPTATSASPLCRPISHQRLLVVFFLGWRCATAQGTRGRALVVGSGAATQCDKSQSKDATGSRDKCEIGGEVLTDDGGAESPAHGCMRFQGEAPIPARN
jgi:hypothetical protein